MRACVTRAAPGQRVERENGWPCVERDVLAVLDRMHRLLPVGFYYKTFLRPRWAWPPVEPMIRRVAGRGTIDRTSSRPRTREVRHATRTSLVIGARCGGPVRRARRGRGRAERVLLCDEGRVRREGSPPGPDARRASRSSLTRSVGLDGSRCSSSLRRIGIYEGPLVLLNAPDLLHLVHPETVSSPTGAVDGMACSRATICPESGSRAARHGWRACTASCPAGRIVVVAARLRARRAARRHDSRAAGADVTARGGRGSSRRRGGALERVVVERGSRREEIACDALVLALGLVARDGLALQAAGLARRRRRGRRDARPARSPTAEERAAGRARGADAQRAEAALPAAPREGLVCLCEDVSRGRARPGLAGGLSLDGAPEALHDRDHGSVPGRAVPAPRARVRRSRRGRRSRAHGPDDRAPAARGITLRRPRRACATRSTSTPRCTSATSPWTPTMEPAGAWQRPTHYGDAQAEYWAVRKGVSVMDVGTLGKFLVAGPDATAFLERLYPCRVADLEPGRFRYAVLLDEHRVRDRRRHHLRARRRPLVRHLHLVRRGHVEASLKDWAETFGARRPHRQPDGGLGAINVAGPRSRELLRRLSCETRSTTRRSPISGTRELDRRGRALPGGPARVRGRALVRAASPAATAAASSGTRCVEAGARSRTSARTGSTRCGCCGSRRATSSSARTPTSTRRRRSSNMELGRQARQAVVRRQARAAARRRARGAAQARRRCRSTAAAPAEGAPLRRRRAPRRPAHVVGLVARARLRRRARLGRAGATAHSRTSSRATGVPRKRGRPRVLRSRGRAAPCLSSAVRRRGVGLLRAARRRSTRWRRAPTLPLRVAPTELLLLGAPSGYGELGSGWRRSTPTGWRSISRARMRPESGAATIALEAFARLSRDPAAARRADFAQGLVAHVSGQGRRARRPSLLVIVGLASVTISTSALAACATSTPAAWSRSPGGGGGA